MTSAAVFDGIGSDISRMAEAVQDARKDELLIDFSRLINTHFGKMVERQSAAEGRPVSAHNNKTVFLEATDLWCRSVFPRPERQGRGARTARELIDAVMRPVYEAMSLNDPARWKGRMEEPPPYAGTYADALCTELGLCACLEIQPIRFRFGIDKGVVKHVWGRVNADGRWWDTDISDPGFRLGDHMKFEEYDEVEVPL